MTVSLHHDPELGPDEVTPDRVVAVTEVDERVDLRPGQPGLAHDGQERLLELAGGRGVTEVMLLKDRLQDAGPPASMVAGKLVLDGAEVEHLEDLGLVARPLDGSAGHDLGQVEERSGDDGARDAVHAGDVRGGQGGRAVDEDAVVASARAAGNGDLDAAVLKGAQLVQGGGGAVGEDGARAAGQDGSHPATLAGEEGLGDEGVDAVVDAV